MASALRLNEDREAWAKATEGMPVGTLTDKERAAVERAKARIASGHVFLTLEEAVARRLSKK